MRGESLAGVRLPNVTRRQWRAWVKSARRRHTAAKLERLEAIERLERIEREGRRRGTGRL